MSPHFESSTNNRLLEKTTLRGFDPPSPSSGFYTVETKPVGSMLSISFLTLVKFFQYGHHPSAANRRVRTSEICQSKGIVLPPPNDGRSKSLHDNQIRVNIQPVRPKGVVFRETHQSIPRAL
jgi:hypothetical protein